MHTIFCFVLLGSTATNIVCNICNMFATPVEPYLYAFLSGFIRHAKKVPWGSKGFWRFTSKIRCEDSDSQLNEISWLFWHLSSKSGTLEPQWYIYILNLIAGTSHHERLTPHGEDVLTSAEGLQVSFLNEFSCSIFVHFKH
jgi:hypothetical protein